MDLSPFMSNQCEALNESNNHTLADCLKDNDNYLESSCDCEVILISLLIATFFREIRWNQKYLIVRMNQVYLLTILVIK